MKTYLERKRRRRHLLIAIAIFILMCGSAVVAIKTAKTNESVYRTAVAVEWVLMVPAMYFIFKR